ncbi:MAG TPA: ABC transporter ATP-binding protein [Propionibacteriaceae bacterium]|nr:ABC transporter ATP-binding protein [Propionibacteriaceae bacterium]
METDDDALPELADFDWLHHTPAVAGTSFWSVARRLPAIVREALALAFRASARDAAATIALNVAAGVLTTLGLLAVSSVLGELFAGGPTPDRIRAALPALLWAGAAVTLRGALTITAGWAQARLTPQVSYEVELRMFDATTAVRLAAFDDAGFAEEMERARHRGQRAAQSIVDSTVNLLTGLVGVVATAAAIAVIEPVLVPCLLLASLPTAVTAIRMARREYLAMLAWITRQRRMWLLEQLMANRLAALEVRAYQLREFLLGEYRRMVRIDRRAQLRLVRAQTATRVAGSILTGLAVLALYATLGSLLLIGFVPLAAAATALLALQSARSSLNIAIQATNQLYEDALYYGDFRSFLARAEAERTASGGVPVAGFDEIRLHGVGLRYPDTETLAVTDVSLTLRRGEVVALVGENGSGKSTVAKLLAGLYRPTAGTITWDGVDATTLDPEFLAAQVAVITQEWWKFPFTARENIAVGRTGRSPGEGPTVEEAAVAASAHEMILDLPNGYETLLNREFKEGQDLSGGQWQRLVSARGFFRDAPLLICDEPSAALDARAEHALFAQLRRRPDRTVVLITHRLANVRHADRIYVMQRGAVVQEGDHATLMAQGGLYRELFDLQASGYLPDPESSAV